MVLQNELKSIKLGTGKINQLLKRGNITATNLKLKLAGTDPSILKNNHFMDDITEPGKTEEERMLAHLIVQEKESLKGLTLIPPNTELYHYKVDQIKTLIQLRNEMEKVVYEQRYHKMWKEYEGGIDNVNLKSW